MGAMEQLEETELSMPHKWYLASWFLTETKRPTFVIVLRDYMLLPLTYLNILTKNNKTCGHPWKHYVKSTLPRATWNLVRIHKFCEIYLICMVPPSEFWTSCVFYNPLRIYVIGDLISLILV